METGIGNARQLRRGRRGRLGDGGVTHGRARGQVTTKFETAETAQERIDLAPGSTNETAATAVQGGDRGQSSVSYELVSRQRACGCSRACCLWGGYVRESDTSGRACMGECVCASEW